MHKSISKVNLIETPTATPFPLTKLKVWRLPYLYNEPNHSFKRSLKSLDIASGSGNSLYILKNALPMVSATLKHLYVLHLEPGVFLLKGTLHLDNSEIVETSGRGDFFGWMSGPVRV